MTLAQFCSSYARETTTAAALPNCISGIVPLRLGSAGTLIPVLFHFMRPITDHFPNM